MPRELGKAKRADITGRFPGEESEHASSSARFLEGAGQLHPLQDGTYMDAPGSNGNGRSTEAPGMPARRSDDTEVAPAPSGELQANQLDSSDGSDTLFDNPFGEEALSPDVEMSLEPVDITPSGNGESLEPESAELQPASLEPMDFEPSSDTLHPSGDDEPELLDSIPDLTSPENDEDDEANVDTDRLPPRSGSLPTVKPEPHEVNARESKDTGVLEPAPAEPLPDRVDFDDLGPDDEDETGLVVDQPANEDDKITSKVEPRTDTDPRSANPDSPVRDTVNFYNQTQSLHGNKERSAGFPTISPETVNSAQPLDLEAESLDAEPTGEVEFGASLGRDEEDTDILENDTLRPQRIEDVLGPEPMALDAQPEAEELAAEAEIAEADQRDTDKFRAEDRQPADLPRPEGTDRLERQELKPGKPGEPEELPAISDERVAGGKDTQRFYVAEIMSRPENSGDTTAELQPAEEGVPPMAAAQSADTAAGLVGEGESSGETRHHETRREPQPEPDPLPEPDLVNSDFIAHREPEASTRLIPEYRLAPEPSDETVDEEASSESRRTDKVSLPDGEDKITEKVAAKSREPEPVSSVVESSARVKRITDSLSQRMKEERVETLRLIEQAESVAVRLREASEASRNDLIALSERRAAIGGNGHGSGETWTPTIGDVADAELPTSNLSSQWEPPEDADASAVAEEAADAAEAEVQESVSVPSDPAPYPSPSGRERVPTRAIGEIVNEVERKERDAPTALSELLEQVSKRFAVQEGGNTARKRRFEDELDEDLNVLVAASSRLREAVEEEQEEDRISGRMPAVDEPEPPRSMPSSTYTERAPEPRQQSSARESGLSRDLDQLWEVLDSRRTSTVLLPATPKPDRIAPRDEDVLEGWTQETLWKTLSGIAVVTFLLGALFVWVLLKLA